MSDTDQWSVLIGIGVLSGVAISVLVNVVRSLFKRMRLCKKARIQSGRQRARSGNFAMGYDLPAPAADGQVLVAGRDGNPMWTSVVAGDGGGGHEISLVAGDSRTEPIRGGDSGNLVVKHPGTNGSGEVQMEPEPPARTAWERILDDA